MTDRLAPVEVTTRHATRVRELTDAFAFVMDRLELVGPDPTVEIRPIWITNVDDPPGTYDRTFEVVVSGMIEEPKRFDSGV